MTLFQVLLPHCVNAFLVLLLQHCSSLQYHLLLDILKTVFVLVGVFWSTCLSYNNGYLVLWVCMRHASPFTFNHCIVCTQLTPELKPLSDVMDVSMTIGAINHLLVDVSTIANNLLVMSSAIPNDICSC